MELAKLKSLLGIDQEDTSQDFNLEFILEDITETILNYCNLEELPSGLVNTAYRMAIDLYRNENVGCSDPVLGPVSSIKEGDISTSFHKSGDDNFKDSLMKNYYYQLDKYRKLVW